MTQYTAEQWRIHQHAIESQQRLWDGFEGLRALCNRCLDPVIWDKGNGGQWLGTNKGRDWSVCHGDAAPDADIHIVSRGDVRWVRVLNPDGTQGPKERWVDQQSLREDMLAQEEPIRRKLRISPAERQAAEYARLIDNSVGKTVSRDRVHRVMHEQFGFVPEIVVQQVTERLKRDRANYYDDDDVDTEWTIRTYTDSFGNFHEERVRTERPKRATAPECCVRVFPSDTRLDSLCERCLWHAGDHPAPLDLLTFDESLDAGSKSGPKALARRPTLRDALHRFLTS